MINNIRLIGAVIALAVFSAGAFFIYKLNRDNNELRFQNENLKTTLTARNDYIDRLNASNAENNEFKEKQYNEMQNLKDAPVDKSILGPDFFGGL